MPPVEFKKNAVSPCRFFRVNGPGSQHSSARPVIRRGANMLLRRQRGLHGRFA